MTRKELRATIVAQAVDITSLKRALSLAERHVREQTARADNLDAALAAWRDFKTTIISAATSFVPLQEALAKAEAERDRHALRAYELGKELERVNADLLKGRIHSHCSKCGILLPRRRCGVCVSQGA